MHWATSTQAITYHFVICLPGKTLAANYRSLYCSAAPANSGVGISLLKIFTVDTIFCAGHGHTSMVGPGGGIARCASVSEAGKANPVRFHHPRD